MVTVEDLANGGFAALPAALGWLLVVMGTAKALFRNMGMEIWLNKLRKITQDRHEQLKRAAWELRRNRELPKGSADDDLDAVVALTAHERDERFATIERLERMPLRLRIPIRLLTCIYCQSFWSALIVYAFSWRGIGWWIPTALAYAIAAAMISERLASAQGRHQSPPQGGGGSCGR